MAKFQGGCLCGAVRYEVDGEPKRVANCHCIDCRKATGSQFATNVFFDADDIQILQGDVKRFDHPADSGNTLTKWFCPNCGSQVFGQGTGSPALKSIKIGSFDNVGDITPQIDIFLSSALPFAQPSNATKHFDRGPK